MVEETTQEEVLMQYESQIEDLIESLRIANEPPNNCRETSLAITKLEEALHWLQTSQARQALSV
jgi:hypothetical protein